MKTVTKKIPGAIILALAAAAAPLSAENGNWQVGNDQIHVVDSTIDVATLAGRMRLLERVERAAQKLCRDRVGNARLECQVQTLRQTAGVQSAWGRALTLALDERGAVQMAAR